MRRETAYKLAGRNHAHPAPGDGLEKRRELRFAASPPGQVESAFAVLSKVERLTVERGDDPLTLTLSYSVLEHTLEAIEEVMRDTGYHLDNGLYARLVRAVVYFCEETQRHNLLSPERLLKRSNEVYAHVYAQHSHGDRDTTPAELREYK